MASGSSEKALSDATVNNPGVERRLAAMLSADAVGYSPEDFFARFPADTYEVEGLTKFDARTVFVLLRICPAK